MAEFEILKNGHREKRVSWDDDILLIGRDAMAAICLPDERISRRHARILVEKELLTVEDLKGPNGTFVNGHREYKRALKDGDRIEVGTYAILVRINPSERFADTPILEGELEGESLFEGGFVSSDGAPTTQIVSPQTMARMRKEHEVKIHPHLVANFDKQTAYFPLKFDSTVIGNSDACQVRIKKMRSSRAVTVTRLDPKTYQVKKLGLCVKLRVAGRSHKVATMGNNGTFEVDGFTFVLNVGRIKQA